MLTPFGSVLLSILGLLDRGSFRTPGGFSVRQAKAGVANDEGRAGTQGRELHACARGREALRGAREKDCASIAAQLLGHLT